MLVFYYASYKRVINLSLLNSHILPGEIRWLTYHGSKRQEASGNMASYDIVLTTYDTLRSDFICESPLFEQMWARVILDEGICSSAPNPNLPTMHTCNL
jgi:SNF2 family DNA or RNA helicase